MSAPTTQQSGPESDDRSPFARPGFIFGAFVVTAVVVMLAWLLLVPAEPETQQQPVEVPVADAPAIKPASPSVCGLAAGNQTPPAVTPDSDWQLVGLIAAPTGPDAGPGATTGGGLPSCYAPTPLGALYAVANYIAASSDPGQRIAAATELTVPGPGQDALIADLQRNLGGRSGDVRIAGFHFVSYDPARTAVIELALTDGHVLAHATINAVWVDGDWKVQPSVTGDVLGEVRPLTSLAPPYVAWSGQ